MPSSYSASLRFELQFTGENVNLWGDKLNAAISRIDSSIAGWTVVALTGNYSLTTANGSADEARSAMLKFTGTGPYTVTVPSVSKQYLIWNATSAALTITTGAGATVILGASDKRVVFTDGSSIYEPGFGGSDVKSYIDNLAWTYNAGALPAQATNAGKFIKTDGLTASWQQIATSDLASFSATAAQVRTGTTTVVALTPGDTYNALAEVALTDAATVALDLSTGINFALTLTDGVGATRTLGAATNGKPGQCGYIRTVQGGTGSKQLNPASPFYKRDGGIPANSTTVGAEDFYFYQVISATKAIYSFARAPS